MKNQQSLKDTMPPEIKNFIPFCEAVAELFFPFVEVAIHDLRSEKLVFLLNNISRRKVGDTTPIKDLIQASSQFPDVFSPYYRSNWNGRPLKCSSVTIRDHRGHPIGLVCLNFDTSLFQRIQEQLGTFLKVSDDTKNPVDLYGGDPREKIFQLVQNYLQENKMTIEHLSREDKKELVKHLYQRGIFNYKSAPTLLAEQLGISRASVYNYLE